MTFLSDIFKANFSSDKNFYRSIKNITGFYPSNIAIYKLAFRHSSSTSENGNRTKDSNERLEFLGDSVIGIVVAYYLFKRFPFKDEGFLSKMRSKIVSRAQHNQLGIKLGLNKFIEKSNTQNPHQQNSINGDAYEAFIGAIYLDKGYNTTYHFILKRIINVHLDMEELETKEVDFKSKFIEWAQKEKKEFIFFVFADGASTTDRQFTIQLIVENTIIGNAQHYSKKRAEQMAAEQALLGLV